MFRDRMRCEHSGHGMLAELANLLVAVKVKPSDKLFTNFFKGFSDI